MGSLGVWAVAVAALLGTSGCWLAEGHKGGRRGGVDTAGVSHGSWQEPRSTVNILCPLHAHTASHGGHYLRIQTGENPHRGVNQSHQP